MPGNDRLIILLDEGMNEVKRVKWDLDEGNFPLNCVWNKKVFSLYDLSKEKGRYRQQKEAEVLFLSD